MFKAAKLLLEMRSRVRDIYSLHWQEESAQPKKRWLSDGVRWELLKPGGRWQTEKIRMRICLKFCPDEPVSPQDDIPQPMKESDPSS
ncbi:KGK domain-containing protein [Kamptonema formosum]|uniref:KGK domain-containing protein n=1 Tax=Kamptonema formosum TaxID=331992 RepID=UPI0008FC05CE